MKKKKIKNLHVRVSGGVNVAGSPFLAPKMFRLSRWSGI